MDEGFVDEAGNDLSQDAEQNEYEVLIGMSVEDILREGQKALFARLVGKCRLGSATHQELAILRNILRDNGLTLGLPPETGSKSTWPSNGGPPLDLPEYGEPEA